MVGFLLRFFNLEVPVSCFLNSKGNKIFLIADQHPKPDFIDLIVEKIWR